MNNSTGLAEFDTTIQKTNELLKEIETAFHWPEDRLNQIVLTSLRKHVSLGEAEDVTSILPKDIQELVGQFI